MRVVNIVEVRDDVVHDITSFGIFEEQLADEVVEKAEALFKSKVIEMTGDDSWEDEDFNNLLGDGYFFDPNNTASSVCICWSEV
jgi:hypothetical protein